VEYYKDNREVRISGIYNAAHVGQKVVLDHVSYGEAPDLQKYPLGRYLKPSVFTVTAVNVVNGTACYTLKDFWGKLTVLTDEQAQSTNPYLHDAEEWMMFIHGREKEMERRKDGRIKHLESQVALLKGILINQGVRVVTSEQADALGLTKK